MAYRLEDHPCMCELIDLAFLFGLLPMVVGITIDLFFKIVFPQ